MKKVTVLSQQDPRWAGQRLGTVNGITIGSDGCYITSLTMVANYFGKIVTPNQLDDQFTSNHWYFNGQGNHNDPADFIRDGDLTLAYPDITLVSVDHYEDVPADLNKLKGYMQDDSLMVVLCIDMGGGNVHFVVAVDCDGTSVTIANPWTGLVEPFGKLYGNPTVRIMLFIVYTGKGGGSMNMYGTPNQYDLSNVESMKVAVDVLNKVNTGLLVDKSKYDADLKTVQDQLKAEQDAYNSVNDKYNTLQQKLNDLTTKYAQDETTIAEDKATISQKKTDMQIVNPETLTPTQESFLTKLLKLFGFA